MDIYYIICEYIGETNAQKVLVLVGNYKNGAYGLSVARQLLNHGYHVTVCMVTSDNPVFKSTDYQRYLFEQIGGTIIYGAQGIYIYIYTYIHIYLSNY